jgi:uncharacterized protein (TIGR02217 family)
MALQETLFPLGVSGWGSSIEYNTTIITGKGGSEIRNANWQDPLYSFNAAFTVRTKAQAQTLIDFFHSVKGKETTFLVKDLQDFAVTDWTTVAESVTGASQEFQLFKKYTNAIATEYDRNIIKVDGSTVELRYNGVDEKTYDATPPPTAETHFSVDDTTGLITYDPPGTASVEFKVGEFYVPCRFDIDVLDIQTLFYYVNASSVEQAQTQIPDIPIREVRI